MDHPGIWIFNGVGSAAPSGVFNDLSSAERWIAEHRLDGMLTRYPLDIGLYDFCVAHALFRPKRPEHSSAAFIGGFTCASIEHFHYENGQR